MSLHFGSLRVLSTSFSVLAFFNIAPGMTWGLPSEATLSYVLSLFFFCFVCSSAFRPFPIPVKTVTGEYVGLLPHGHFLGMFQTFTFNSAEKKKKKRRIFVIFHLSAFLQNRPDWSAHGRLPPGGPHLAGRASFKKNPSPRHLVCAAKKRQLL